MLSQSDTFACCLRSDLIRFYHDAVRHAENEVKLAAVSCGSGKT